jgi:chromate transporter
MTQILLQLASLFVVLSVLAFGGGAGVIPDMQRAVVDTNHWMTAREFLDMFAISRAAPGPGSLIVVLIGQKVAGPAGAAVSFVAMFTPSCVVIFFVSRIWHRAGQSAWREIVERAFAPIAVGLTFASGLVLLRGSEHSLASYAVTVIATVAFAFTEINPLFLLGGGAAALLALGG